MIIYVIHQQQLFSMTLPLNISGSYTLTDIDNNNKERNLINISEQNGKWVAVSNKHVKIWHDKKALDSIVLESYQYLLLQVKGEEGFLVMYSCPVNDSSFIGVKVPKNMDFIIGSGGDNAISCNNPLIGHKHAKITYQDGIWSIEDLSTQYGTFVNNQLIRGRVPLFHGDVVFILGLKLIVLANTIYFNNPLGSVIYNKNLFDELPVREKIPLVTTNDEDN
ncbi:MAG: FHA domain-containing protein, partial [Bacilli bacterium]|nr:FHA domain-containing protein [Bacilli bacterium]